MKILLVEDDGEVAGAVSHALATAGYEVDTASDGFRGLSRASSGIYAALILDRMLPRLDGLSLMKRLRATGIKTPVLLLTTMTGIDDRVEGLEAGADDYLTKPFDFAELLARVNAMTRRAEINGRASPTKLVVADLEMDLIERTVRRAGQLIDLQAQEFRLLDYLMRNCGRTVTRTMLLEHVWNLNFAPRTNLVETHMSRLRSKLGLINSRDMIQTIRGTGYILCVD